MQKQTTLIIGANSEIAKALALQVIEQDNSDLIVISRNVDFYQQQTFQDCSVIAVEDYQQSSIHKAVQAIQQINCSPPYQVFICHGLLHTTTLKPEKKLLDFCAENFALMVSANSTTPMLWLTSLLPLLCTNKRCSMVFFSARVASINDNRLGGWYSYRASKAALNMLLKSAAIELARSAINIKLISFHPGTTDTPLSKPFQKNVPAGKLFTPTFVAQQLLQIVQRTEIDGQLSFIDWKGKQIPW